MNTLAIDIGGTKFSVALFEGESIAARITNPTDRGGGPEWMLHQLESAVQGWRFQRCGVGFGGPVQFDRRRVALSTHVAGWSDFPLAARLEASLGVPVVMDNDANAGALGEAVYGAGRGKLPLFYLTLSTGIGGGIVLEAQRVRRAPQGGSATVSHRAPFRASSLKDGAVYRGADSWAGEIGHITLHPDGPECLCGARGCFERMCGGLWLERDHGKPAAELMRDPAFVARYVVDLAQGLKAAIMLLNPALIVIGGGIAQAGELLFAPLRAELRRQITTWSQARLDVVPAALGNDSVLWGALALAGHAT